MITYFNKNTEFIDKIFYEIIYSIHIFHIFYEDLLISSKDYLIVDSLFYPLLLTINIVDILGKNISVVWLIKMIYFRVLITVAVLELHEPNLQ
jgi:hypothetical protein